LAKSSQDTRDYLRENNENFDQKAKRAELTSNILLGKSNAPFDRRSLPATVAQL
jgi:hypothetical protein